MIFTITRIRTPKDGRGSTQNRVRIANSQPKNEHGCTFQNGHGCPGFYAAAMFLLSKNSRPEVYTDVHFRTGYFQK